MSPKETLAASGVGAGLDSDKEGFGSTEAGCGSSPNVGATSQNRVAQARDTIFELRATSSLHFQQTPSLVRTRPEPTNQEPLGRARLRGENTERNLDRK